ncbi:23843_t:CDS:2, partial [Dentiscutata erythropus]
LFDMGSNQSERNPISVIYRLNVLKDIKEYKFSDFNDRKKIGHGAFGEVFSADFQGKIFALKRLHKENLIDKMIVRELEALYEADHPNIIKFYGISEAVKFITNNINNTQLTIPVVRTDQHLEFFEEDNDYEDSINNKRSLSIRSVVEIDPHPEFIEKDNLSRNLNFH